jgi:hypothetical protein
MTAQEFAGGQSQGEWIHNEMRQVPEKAPAAMSIEISDVG